MAMGKRKQEDPNSFWVAASGLPKTSAHPFYERTNQILDSRQFDPFVESLCQKFYAQKLG